MHKHLSSERAVAKHVLNSTFVPAATGNDDARMAVTSPELGQSALWMLIVAELSAELAKHLEPISEEVRASKHAIDKLENSISQLSTQIESRPACFESLPVLRHWDAALDKLGLHLKASQANEQLSKVNLDRLKEVDSLCSRGNGNTHDVDIAVASFEKHALAPTSNVALLGPAPSESNALGSSWRCKIDGDAGGRSHRLSAHIGERSTNGAGNKSISPSTSPQPRTPASLKVYAPDLALARRCKASQHANRNTMLSVFAEHLESREEALLQEAPISKFCSHTVRTTIVWLANLEEPPRSGFLARVVESKEFGLFFGLVIFANVVILIVGANHQMYHLGDNRFEHLEWLFLVCYTVEIAMKLAVHQWYFFVGSDCAWNIYDTVLLAASVYSGIVPLLQWNGSFSMGVVQVLRSFRVVRAIRLIHVFVDMRRIIKVIFGTLFGVLGSMLILVFLLLVFGLICVHDLSAKMGDLENRNPELVDEVRAIFGSVHLGMFTLFRSVFSGEAWNKHFQVVAQISSTTAAVFIFFVVFMQISFFNALTAMFVVNMKKVAKPDQHTKAMKEVLNQRKNTMQIRELCQMMDQNGSQTISREEFYESLNKDHIRIQFMLCGLNINNAEDFFELLLSMSKDNEVELEKLVTACVMMKGGATAIEQNMMLLEARDFQHRVNNHFFELRHWQKQVIGKLDSLGAGSRHAAL